MEARRGSWYFIYPSLLLIAQPPSLAAQAHEWATAIRVLVVEDSTTHWLPETLRTRGC